MKRGIAILLLVALTLGISGCSTWVKNEYLSVTPHVEQSVPASETQEEETPLVTNRNELRGAVLSLIRNWTERGILLVRDYDGDVSSDLSEILDYATSEDPIGAYAVDYADAELTGSVRAGRIEVSIVFRRSAAEIGSIVTVSNNSAALRKIQQALVDSDTALTLRIRDYQQTDFEADIRDYCLEHPELILAIPEISAELYPREGATRILELHFSYPESRDRMRTMLSSVNTILSSATAYVCTGKTDNERAALLHRFLTSRFRYEIEAETPSMPAYRLLCEGAAHSLSFASVVYAECAAAGLECRIVTGTRGGASHYWNLLCIDGEYYYVDLMRSVERDMRELTLLTSEQLKDEDYAWPEDDYPATPSAEEPPQPPDPTEPTSETESTEHSAEPTEPTEEPTEQPTEAPTQAPYTRIC